MNTEHFKIAVIGAGHAGIELLQQLFDAEFVDIVGVADTKKDAPGMVLAREHQIPTTEDMNRVLVSRRKIDIMIDLTGVTAVRDHLRQHMRGSGN